MNDECLTICFYNGPKERPDLSLEATRIIALMGTWGVPSTHIGLSGERAPSKLLSANVGLKRLESSRLGDIDGLTLLSCPDSTKAPAFDWNVLLSVTHNATIGGTRNVVCESSLTEIINTQQSLVPFMNGEDYAYGFALAIPKHQMPDLYILTGPTDGDEQTRTASRLWQEFSMLNEPLGNRLRDIYPINYLSEKHLSLPLSNSTFKDLLVTSGATTNRRIAGLDEYLVPLRAIGSIREIMRTTGYVISLAK